MTAANLNTAGYNVSPLIDDAIVTRWEGIVAAAYIEPIVGAYDSTDSDQLAAAMALTYIALAVNNTHATRSGGKVKLSPQLSERANVTQADVEEAHRLLQVLADAEGVTDELDLVVNDVLHIYFRTYMSMN